VIPLSVILLVSVGVTRDYNALIRPVFKMSSTSSKTHSALYRKGATLAVQQIVALLMVLWPLVSVQAALRVIDDAGQVVMLARPAQRIVSLAPYITELLFSAGAGAAVIGVSEYSDFPGAAASITRIGGGSGLDLEAIVALQPDLVVAWQSGNPAGQLERLQSLGMAVFLSEPRQLADVPATLLRLGQLAGTESVAKVAADNFRQRALQLERRYAQRPAVRVFYQIWDQPLMTLNGDHLVSDVIRLCGGTNVFGNLSELVPRIDIEAVLAADPAVIVVAADAEDSPLLDAWQQWPSITAVAQGHVYAIARDRLVRHSTRILDGAEELCTILDGARN
jgi:iron complex transport system substrate-binding protein